MYGIPVLADFTFNRFSFIELFNFTFFYTDAFNVYNFFTCLNIIRFLICYFLIYNPNI